MSGLFIFADFMQHEGRDVAAGRMGTPASHRALDELEAVHVSFDLSVLQGCLRAAWAAASSRRTEPISLSYAFPEVSPNVRMTHNVALSGSMSALESLAVSEPLGRVAIAD
jgi:hypothetical protein